MKTLYQFILESKETDREVQMAEIVQIMRKMKNKSDNWDAYTAEVACKIVNNDFENVDYDDIEDEKSNPKYVIWNLVGENNELCDLVIELMQDNFKVLKNAKGNGAILTKKNFSEYEGIKKLILGYYLTNTDINWTNWLKDYKGDDKESIIKKIYEQ